MTLPPLPRAHVRQPRRLTLVVGGVSQALTADISAGGLSFDTLTALAVGEHVQATVQVAGASFELEGVVAHVTEATAQAAARVGLQFTRVAPGFVGALGTHTAGPLHATVTQEQGAWVVRVQKQSGKHQEYRCAQESYARRFLAAVLGSNLQLA